MREVVEALEVRGPLLPAPRRASEGGAPAAGPPALRRRSRQRNWPTVVVAVLLGAALVAALALAAHLWLAQDAWRAQAEDAEAQRTRLAVTSVELQRRLDGLQADLDASDARVEQLAAEKARATDLLEAGKRRSGASSGRS